ncbi:2'-5' RNA ligase family protein [Novosphingobium sp.]
MADRLRRAHFPPERNHLAAHVTLFHAVPGRLEDEARAFLARLAAETAPVDALLCEVMDLGSGTALRIESPQLLNLRDHIAEHFHGMLTAQDSHRPRLHVTVQNKVERADARALQQELASNFRPRRFAFAGLALHRYLDGPWDDAGRWTFRSAARRRD